MQRLRELRDRISDWWHGRKNCYWTGADVREGDEDTFNNPRNWAGGRMPRAGDNIIIPHGSIAPCPIGYSPLTFNRVLMLGGAATFPALPFDLAVEDSPGVATDG